ncbi:ribonuclease E/G [Melaminivora suipulveris]|uniref:Ribonuclease E n=1 Tax=Melaminivora suipulveris TaxID=2109913 RepID=A0A2R3Q9S0_9BURK|nr:Rne/Rng family ribonuclease [Melaminivora suipulveris]AVO48387.1 ribonuclease E/G [Melaminivora suipulveris]
MKRMLINATQPEERRLAIVDGQKLLDYEIEIEGREQRKGNIYKAVVTRVEPSLEACFVDYGEDRHGFLPFKEISKQYFAEGVSPSQARIQDVIREGDELIVQVEKEERGNKGAALTTFVSLAGRYVVLMPNNPRGGGVSRRIEGEDRAELKEAMDQLEYPKGMSIIARTAGIGRTAPELQWDLNYLLKLWNAIDGAAKAGRGAFLIYQESSLVIRAIRDYFNSDIGDILIDTDDIYEQAQQFMAHVMPEHAARVKRYRDDAPLFSRFQIEHQIESAYSRTVTLPSGGAIVIDHTEALVSVDVNSARAIKGGDIEETATRTNLEAADEVARQMRLRDLGGLIVIDFIDMEESKNRREVENRLRDALRQDRARVQFGTISKFGLMEMSRQRLKPSLSEGAHIRCPLCDGTGHVRDTEGFSLQMLRMIQEESMKDNTAAVHCQVPVEVASFLLNEKRTEIAKIELKQRVSVVLIPSKALDTPHYRLERLKHDDPRLDDMQASYKLADPEPEHTHITRRSQEPTNKQTPVIKGVLPDAPAPVAEPRPSQAAGTQPRGQDTRGAGQQQRGAANAPVQPPAPAPAPAPEQGFFAWLKSLLGFGPAPAPAPVVQPAPQPQPAAHGEGRREATGGRSSGERSRRGRGGEAVREGASAAAGGTQGQSRGRRGNGNGGNGGERSGEGRGGRGSRGERVEGAAAEAGSESSRRAPREGRGSRERGERTPADAQVPVTATGEETGAAPQARAPRSADERSGGEPRRSRGGSRGPRTIDADAPAPAVRAAQDFADTSPLASLPDLDLSPASVSTPASEGSAAPEAAEGSAEPRRERRSRDRYGRDRRERAPRNAEGEATGTADAAQDESVPMLDIDLTATGTAPQGAEQTGRRSYFAASSSTPAPMPQPMPGAAPAPQAAAAGEAAALAPELAQVDAPREETVAAPVGEPAPQAPAAPSPAPQAQPQPQAAEPTPSALPAATAFALPVQALAEMAQACGLQWVNSDADKVAAVQAAIAAEPRPVHVPRERPAPVALDEGPLVLVETRRDLGELRLPFQSTTP